MYAFIMIHLFVRLTLLLLYLWISWGYACDLWMMLQLAMSLTVCRNKRFRQSLVWVRSSSWVSVHMCCMMHVLTNVGQVVKNLFPESIACLLLCRKLGGQRRSTARMIRTRLGELRFRTIDDAG